MQFDRCDELTTFPCDIYEKKAETSLSLLLLAQRRSAGRLYLRPRGAAAGARAGLPPLAGAGAAGFLTLMVSRMDARTLVSSDWRAVSEPVSALARWPWPVSYTHLTLPTIYSV